MGRSGQKKATPPLLKMSQTAQAHSQRMFMLCTYRQNAFPSAALFQEYS